MNPSRSSVAVVLLAAAAAAGACHHPQQAPAPLPPMPVAPLSEPPVVVSPADTTAARAAEKMITLTGEWDVRLALEEIARTAGYSLIISPKIQSKKIRVSLINVPASEALRAVLDAGQLTLEGTRGPTIPWNPSVVFYQLPVNVDSLGVEAIMKRFGVSRDIANLMVQSRVKP